MDKGGAQREKLVSSDGRVHSQPSKASGKHHLSLLLEHVLCFRYFVKVFLTPTTVIQSRNPEAVLYRANGRLAELRKNSRPGEREQRNRALDPNQFSCLSPRQCADLCADLSSAALGLSIVPGVGPHATSKALFSYWRGSEVQGERIANSKVQNGRDGI